MRIIYPLLYESRIIILESFGVWRRRWVNMHQFIQLQEVSNFVVLTGELSTTLKCRGHLWGDRETYNNAKPTAMCYWVTASVKVTPLWHIYLFFLLQHCQTYCPDFSFSYLYLVQVSSMSDVHIILFAADLTLCCSSTLSQLHSSWSP